MKKYLTTISISMVLGLITVHTKAGDKEPVLHRFLGVDVDNVQKKTEGLFINGIYKGYGAEKAGLRRGDYLMAINDAPVYNFDMLIKEVDRYKVGDEVYVTILRNGRRDKIQVSLSDYPEFLRYNSYYWLKKLGMDGFRGEVKVAKLGIEADPVWDKYALEVKEVARNSAAEKAGLQSGDIILGMDDYTFATMEELRYYLSKYKPGDIVSLSVIQNAVVRPVKVVLGEEILKVKPEKEKNKEDRGR